MVTSCFLRSNPSDDNFGVRTDSLPQGMRDLATSRAKRSSRYAHARLRAKATQERFQHYTGASRVRTTPGTRYERADLHPEPDARAGAPPTGALPGSAVLRRIPEADELHARAQPPATQVSHTATDRLPVERDATGTAHRRPDIGLKHSPFLQRGGQAGERAPFYGSDRQRIALNIALVSPATIRQGDELPRRECGEARAVAERPRLGLCAPGVLHLGRATCRLPPLPGPSRGLNGA